MNSLARPHSKVLRGGAIVVVSVVSRETTKSFTHVSNPFIPKSYGDTDSECLVLGEHEV
jgi:hypothetical protein